MISMHEAHKLLVRNHYKVWMIIMTKEERQEQRNLYNRETYHALKRLGLCKCGKRLAVGFAACPECLEKNAEQKRRKRRADREAVNTHASAYRKNVRKLRAEQGLCTKCGKPLKDKGHRWCAKCLAEHNAKQNWRRRQKMIHAIDRSEWPNYGYCYHCGQPVMKPYRVCKECYERDVEHLKIANQSEKGIKTRRAWMGWIYTGVWNMEETKKLQEPGGKGINQTTQRLTQ